MCDLSCRFKCSKRANDLEQVAQTWGLGLSVFGGGNWAPPLDAPFNDLACGRPYTTVSSQTMNPTLEPYKTIGMRRLDIRTTACTVVVVRLRSV